MDASTKTKESSPAKPAARRLASLGRNYGLQIGIVVVGLIIWLLFLIGAPGTFSSPLIYHAFMATTPLFAIMAIPLTLLIISAEIDLSFPSIMAFSVTLFSIMYVNTGSVLLAFVMCLLAGLFAGFLNGLIVVKIGIPALVATIGTQFFWRGVVLVVNAGSGTSLVGIKESPLYEFLVGRVTGIPAQMIWLVLIAIAVWFFLNRTKIGAHVYLVGDNIDSSRLMGINVEARKILLFSLVGLAAAFAGLIASLQVNYFWPTLGEGYLLRTLASVFLGGTSVFGGTGTIFGTFIAAFIIGAIEAGIVAVGMAGFWTQLIYGLIIIISVAIQTLISRRFR